VFFLEGRQIKYCRKSWITACKEAGLSEKLFHDLRRTGVRNLIRSGVPEAVAMRISGHKTRSVFDRYNITSENDLKSAAEKLTEHHRRMREKLERKQREATERQPADTGAGTGSVLKSEIQAFSDPKTLK